MSIKVYNILHYKRHELMDINEPLLQSLNYLIFEIYV